MLVISPVEFTITELIGILGGIGTLFVIVYKLGGLAKQVIINQQDIRSIWGKIDQVNVKLDRIWGFMRNGRSDSDPGGPR